ncbi:nitrogen fixation protein NifM [Mariprofundus ferrooxydans]|uniref:nitrogen fixation protein NifM n=1 Tax=Mariprofundus ferrooxydans TaxID=314344 RepID=UPI0003730DB0|nr:nitrogen fixation protein NifM [Mariprofundus ferrooxydans]
MVEAVDAYLLLNAAAQLFGKTPSELEAPQWQEAVALAEKESLLQEKILASSEAEAVVVSEEEISNARTEVESRFPERREFLENLARNGMNESTLTDSLANSLKVEKTMNLVGDGAPFASDTEVAAFYHDNLDKFDRPELREARHILITINNDYPENRRKVALARMKKLAKELAEKPEDFADLAMRHSECPTALEGGLLGKLPQGKLYAELDSVLFAMAEGEISAIIESPIGLHILCCERIHPAGIAPLQEADASIRQHLNEPRRRAAQKQWIRSLFSH